jgi:hypothetical protein
MTYGFDAETLVVWIDSFDRVTTDRSGVLCRRHADAMVVPLGWMLDDRRDPIPRLFKAPAQTATAAPRQRRAYTHHHNDAEQLEFGAEVVADEAGDEPVVAVVADEAAGPVETEVQPWKPTFDQTDDLDGLLEAHSPLLARAFGGQERRRPITRP